MVEIFLGLGSNIDREKHLSAALNSLRMMFGSISQSSIYETAAIGFNGPPFYNMVVSLNTSKSLAELGQCLRNLELNLGRQKQTRKFVARTIDIDLLLYGDLVTPADSAIQLPREDITRYAFVLEPLAEIAPERIHPVLKISYQDLWNQFDKTGLQQKKIVLDTH